MALAGTVVLAASPSQAALKKAPTPFAYQGSAFGTRVSAGDPTAGGVASGRTAWSVLGCTSLAPTRQTRGSHVGKVNANDYIQVGAVDSSTGSYRKPRKQVFGSRSVNKVANIVLGPSDGPRLKVRTLTTTANAFNAKGRFRSVADIDLSGVDAVGISPDGSETPGPLGDLLDAIDQADDQAVEAVIEGAGSDGIDIPGLGTIYPAGKAETTSNRRMAASNTFGIRVELANGSRVTIGRAWAKTQVADPAAVFAGHAYGLEAIVAEGVLGLGRTPFQPLPCAGTKGRWRTNSLAELPQNPDLDAGVLRAETFGKPFADGRAIARSRSSLADLTLGGGQLEVKRVIGQVNVFQNRAGRVTRRTIDGTTVGAIIVNGETQDVPSPGEALKIPGLALVRAAVRENIGKRGLLVHALRVEMLDGTGLVLNVGTARAVVKR